MIRKIAIVPSVLLLVVAAFSIMPGCREDDQVLTFRVQANEWADPSIPASDATIVLEEQRLSNGVVNSFYTEVERKTSGSDGLVELQTIRSNVLSIRIRTEKEGCFADIVELNPENLTSGDNPNDVEVIVMPQCLIRTEVDNNISPCPYNDVLFQWIPRDVVGAASDTRWTCETAWQSVPPGEVHFESCYITGNTWLLHKRFWSCADSTYLDSIWCPAGEEVELILD